MPINHLLAKAFFLSTPSLFFAVSYRYSLGIVLVSCLILAIAWLIANSIALQFRNSSFRVLVAGSTSLYGIFKAISFSDLYSQIHTLVYYAVFTPMFFLLAFRALSSYLRSYFLAGFVLAAFAIQALYLAGFMDWNQYQIVGNVTVLALVAAYVLRWKVISVVLVLLVINTPSTQSQVLLLLFLFYLIYTRVYGVSGHGLGKNLKILSLSIVVLPILALLVINFGQALVFSDQSNARQFEFALRVYDRTLIFLDQVALINPVLPVSQREIESISREGVLASAETRVHGIWLAYLVYMGALLGIFALSVFLWGVWRLSNRNVILMLLCLTPWLISSEVNPIKYALCALAIIQTFNSQPRLVQSRESMPVGFQVGDKALPA